MVNKILQASGFVKGKTYTQTRFLVPPKSTYAIYLDDYNARGSDDAIFIKEHSYTIELYAYQPDSTKEQSIERAFAENGIAYDKQDRIYIQEERLFLTIYDFDFVEKLN